MPSLHRIRPLFTAFLTALVALPGCTGDAGEPSDRFAAFTPGLGDEDPLDGASLALAASRSEASIELADGEVVDFELGAAQGEDLLGDCEAAFADGDRALLEVRTRPLVVGDFTFDAPVLEASCDAETATNHLILREAEAASCADGECLSFAAPEAIEASRERTKAAPAGDPSAACQAAGTSTCVSCGGGKLRTKTITQVNYDPNTGACTYGYSYGTCVTACPL